MIVFCHLLNDYSGSPVVLRQAIQTLSRDPQSSVLFVGRQGGGILETVDIPIRRYWYHRSRFRLITLFTYAVSQISLYRALSREKLPKEAILYVNTLLPFAAALWGYRHNRTVIYHVHEVSISPNLLRRFLIGIAKKTAHHVLYVSEDHRKRLPISGVSATVLPNSIPAHIAYKGSATLYSAQRSNRFEVLMLASPRDFKGVPEFLNLARRFNSCSDICFTLVLNAQKEEISAYISKANQPANVTIHPRTNCPEKFYSTADVLVNLSRVDQWIETFGMTLVEAMAFGLPVIAPPVGGPTEIVTDGIEGYLIDSRDASALEKKIRILLDNPTIALEMSKAARQRALAFTVERFAENLQSTIRLFV